MAAAGASPPPGSSADPELNSPPPPCISEPPADTPPFPAFPLVRSTAHPPPGRPAAREGHPWAESPKQRSHPHPCARRNLPSWTWFSSGLLPGLHLKPRPPPIPPRPRQSPRRPQSTLRWAVHFPRALAAFRIHVHILLYFYTIMFF